MNTKWIYRVLLLFIGAIVVLIGHDAFDAQTSLLSTFDNANPSNVFNLLISLWFIAWILESFLEVLIKILVVH